MSAMNTTPHRSHVLWRSRLRPTSACSPDVCGPIFDRYDADARRNPLRAAEALLDRIRPDRPVQHLVGVPVDVESGFVDQVVNCTMYRDQIPAFRGAEPRFFDDVVM